MRENAEMPPEWFTPAGQAVWARIPAVTFLRPEYSAMWHEHSEDEFAGANFLMDLLQGHAENLDDLDDDSRIDGAGRVVFNACVSAGIRQRDLPLAELDTLLGVAFERDESPRLVEEWARKTGVVTIGIMTPQGDRSDLLEFLGLPPGGLPHDPTPGGQPITNHDNHDVMDALCHVRPLDLLRLADASQDQLVTLPVSLLNTDDEDAYMRFADAPAGATLVIRVGEMREKGWVLSPARVTQRTKDGYTVPMDVPEVTLSSPPEGPESDTYESLLADGRTTRSALAAAKSLRLLDEPPGCDPRRTITVSREVSRRDWKDATRDAGKGSSAN